jgi:hypothetical protein
MGADRWNGRQCRTQSLAIGVLAKGDKFTVSLDDAPLFTMWDRTFLRDGRIGLWAEEDNLTRFDQLEMTALPGSEEER